MIGKGLATANSPIKTLRTIRVTAAVNSTGN